MRRAIERELGYYRELGPYQGWYTRFIARRDGIEEALREVRALDEIANRGGQPFEALCGLAPVSPADGRGQVGGYLSTPAPGQKGRD